MRPSPPLQFSSRAGGVEHLIFGNPWAETLRLDWVLPFRRWARQATGPSWADLTRHRDDPFPWRPRGPPGPNKMEIGGGGSVRSTFWEFLVEGALSCQPCISFGRCPNSIMCDSIIYKKYA